MTQTRRNTGSKRSGGRSNPTSGRNYQKKTTTGRNTEPMDTAIRNEIILIALLAVTVVLFLCNFGVIGEAGDAVSGVMFGLFGMLAYIVPIVLFLMIAFGMVNAGNQIASRKIIAGIFLVIMIGVILELFTGKPAERSVLDLKFIYDECRGDKNGGGVLTGTLAFFLYKYLGMLGTVLVILVGAVISLVVITDKSFMTGVKKGGRRVYERTREDARYRRERAQTRREELERERQYRQEQKELKREEKENEKILRMDKKVRGVIDPSLRGDDEKKEKVRDDIHEINLNVQEGDSVSEEIKEVPLENEFQFRNIPETYSGDEIEEITDIYGNRKNYDEITPEPEAEEEPEEEMIKPLRPVREKPAATGTVRSSSGAVGQVVTGAAYEQLHRKKEPSKKYSFPPLDLLKKGMAKSGDSSRELKETAERLRQTLQTFGVKVEIKDISQGPAVTRYELQPEQGVKVSKIVGLADDIKLNLAATDIRIEAPIPGKAAIGIEVPNKENTAVALRDLLESESFKKFDSKIAFAVGKDISGKVVVTDIAKMPHMLIAGATGSGKSVCINTLIMSILYKARPEEVQLIMIDPKVVELSVYNGIPHLMIPVVTDPKKAAAALHWGVAEMTDRYQKFADFNVRDLKGYNQKIEKMQADGEDAQLKKMPQIVIIVDELADLMMVAPGEVEESICRLAQLARAAGIHLIIATQRPSVDVITGLIKANMPSRIAFSVSSGVDSRTILDMNGAEKLLGKGDMLFYPQGYTKPARVQGAFVSDSEVARVVEYLKNQKLGNLYEEDLQDQITKLESAGGSAGNKASELDEYFTEAGRFIIEKDKASIGMLQRVFKIGFNRAARIMDQLCEAGVVGEEEGTKPRKILMSPEQFEQYLEDHA